VLGARPRSGVLLCTWRLFDCIIFGVIAQHSLLLANIDPSFHMPTTPGRSVPTAHCPLQRVPVWEGRRSTSKQTLCAPISFAVPLLGYAILYCSAALRCPVNALCLLPGVDSQVGVDSVSPCRPRFTAPRRKSSSLRPPRRLVRCNKESRLAIHADAEQEGPPSCVSACARNRALAGSRTQTICGDQRHFDPIRLPRR
jgi:hypothetical protein